jgi:hypothetical protein
MKELCRILHTMYSQDLCFPKLWETKMWDRRTVPRWLTCDLLNLRQNMAVAQAGDETLVGFLSQGETLLLKRVAC